MIQEFSTWHFSLIKKNALIISFCLWIKKIIICNEIWCSTVFSVLSWQYIGSILCLFYQDIPINWHFFQHKQSVMGKCLIVRLRVNQKIHFPLFIDDYVRGRGFSSLKKYQWYVLKHFPLLSMDQFLYFTIKWIRTVKDKLKSLIERETIL